MSNLLKWMNPVIIEYNLIGLQEVVMISILFQV